MNAGSVEPPGPVGFRSGFCSAGNADPVLAGSGGGVGGMAFRPIVGAVAGCDGGASRPPLAATFDELSAPLRDDEGLVGSVVMTPLLEDDQTP